MTWRPEVGPVICRASVTRAEVADGRVWDTWAAAEARCRNMIETEREFAEGCTGRAVAAVVFEVQRDSVTSSRRVSVSAVVTFEVEGGGSWRPDSTRVVSFASLDEDDDEIDGYNRPKG